MRTTLIVEDELYRRAKRRAADSDLTLSQVVNDALRTSLASAPSKPSRFRWITFGRAPRVRHEPADFARALEQEERARSGSA